MTANLLTEICHNVATEPLLQPLTNESFPHRTANTDANARLDIRARGFWNTGQDAFFDVRVFHPNASSNRSMTTAAAYRKHEPAKKREYAQRVREVEHGVFTPLVLSTTGGMAREATTFYKRLADELSRKQDKQYSLVMGWIRCRLSFAILRSAISSAFEEVDPLATAQSGSSTLNLPLQRDVFFCFSFFGFLLFFIGRAGASPPSRTAAIIFLYIYIFIGRAGASPPSRTAAIIFLVIRVVRRALNLLRASFSPIFQYFSAVNDTRVSFSLIFLTCMPWRRRFVSHGRCRPLSS